VVAEAELAAVHVQPVPLPEHEPHLGGLHGHGQGASYRAAVIRTGMQSYTRRVDDVKLITCGAINAAFICAMEFRSTLSVRLRTCSYKTKVIS
jgi:hypothetical protein